MTQSCLCRRLTAACAGLCEQVTTEQEQIIHESAGQLEEVRQQLTSLQQVTSAARVLGPDGLGGGGRFSLFFFPASGLRQHRGSVPKSPHTAKEFRGFGYCFVPHRAAQSGWQ